MARDTVAVDRKRPETYRLIGDASVPVPNDADEQMARAAWQAAEVLARMKAEGYGLPDSLVIGLNSRIDSQRPSGEVTQTGGAEVRRANLILRVPRLLPLGVSLNEAIAIANKKTAIASVSGAKRLYVGQSFEDTVVHEMGHVQHERTLWAARGRGIDSDDVTPFPLAQKTPFEVSTYAGVNPAEFVAETFTALYRGESFSPAVMNLYRALHGPQVRNYPARQAAYERRRRAVYDEVIDAWIAERKQ